MNKGQIRRIAEQVSEEEISWSVSEVAINSQNPSEWEIYFDACGRKYHKILFRIAPAADFTPDSIKAQLRNFIRQLKQSSRF